MKATGLAKPPHWATVCKASCKTNLAFTGFSSHSSECFLPLALLFVAPRRAGHRHPLPVASLSLIQKRPNWSFTQTSPTEGLYCTRTHAHAHTQAHAGSAGSHSLRALPWCPAAEAQARAPGQTLLMALSHSLWPGHHGPCCFPSVFPGPANL